MTLIEKFNYINILGIWGYILTGIWIVSRMEYDLIDYIKAFGNWNAECFQYLKTNKYYIPLVAVILFLLVLSMGLLSQAYSGMIRIRTELTLIMSICMFVCTAIILILMFLRIIKLEQLLKLKKY